MAPKKEPAKPKLKFTSKLTYPGEIYRGNTDHWSIARVKADTYVARERMKEQKKAQAKRQEEDPFLDLMEPVPGCTTSPFMWSRNLALSLRGDFAFSDFVVEGLGGELPGDLSKDLHKNYNKRVIDWPPNCWRLNALDKHYKYWALKDMTLKLSRPRKDRTKLAI